VVARRGQHAPRGRAGGWHFLKSTSLVRRLVAGAAISHRDLVLDLGAGRGIITAELARTGARVRAIELDSGLAAFLRKRFSGFSHVDVVAEDILTFELPSQPFKVVANLPFSVTTAVLRRLLDPDSCLEMAWLIVQKGVALKRIRERGNLMNALVGPWFTMTMEMTVPRTAFAPPPNVDCAVLGIRRNRPSLLATEDRWAYQRSVRHAFRFAQVPLSKSLAEIYGGKNAKTVVHRLSLEGATAMNLNAEEWAQLFRTLKTWTRGQRLPITWGDAKDR
jgi:23S rRNA (adenine-N6)-dimethyltransferase